MDDIQAMRNELEELRKERERDALLQRLRASPLLNGSSGKVQEWLADDLAGAADAGAAISLLDAVWRRHEHDIRRSQEKAATGQRKGHREPLGSLRDMSYTDAVQLYRENPAAYQQAKALFYDGRYSGR